MQSHSETEGENMNVMPGSHRYILFPFLLVFSLPLAGCIGGPGGTGLQNKQSATVTIEPSSGSVTAGLPVTLEAYIYPVLASGTVTFYNGSNAIGTAAIGSSAFSQVGIALLATTFSSTGQQTITARYSGDAFYSPSTSSAVTINVYSGTLASTSVNLQASTTTPQYQTNVTLTATVSPSSATGTVTFYNGSTAIGSATVSGGTASAITSFAAGGTATLRAVYSGDYNYASSTSNLLTMNVSGPQATSTTLKVSASTISIGDSVTLTANLSPATASGTVTFYNGSTAIGTANVNAGTATLTTTFAASGHIVVKAVFAASSSWQASTSSLVPIFVTGDTPDTVVLVAAPSPLVIGYSATLTATVSPAAATGTVTFYDGTQVLGNSTLSGGTAALVNTFMSSGPQSLTAVYTGDTTYIPNISSAITLQVSNPGPTLSTTTLVLSETSGYDGDTVTLTATVSPAAVTGQVSFYDNGGLLQSVALSSGIAAWSQPFTMDGENNIVAVYQGDATYRSSSSASQDLQISEPPSTTPTCPGDPSCPSGPTSCPSDPTLCQIECPGDPSCPPDYSSCPSDPTLCAEECPSDPDCPFAIGSSSTAPRRRTNLNGPLILRTPLLKRDGIIRKGC
jgi:Bacterial Ig-like domain (group 3)